MHMASFREFKKKAAYLSRQAFYSLSDLCVKRHVAVTPKTLLIVKNDHIGDYILFRNFLPYLRSSVKYKDYKIVLLGNIAWKDLASNADRAYYDELLWVDFKKLAKDFSYRSKTMKELSERGYDTLFYPVYSGDFFTENFLIAKLHAKHKIKFASLGETTSSIFSQLLPSSRGGMFELYRYQEMMETFLSITIEEIKGLPLYSIAKDQTAILPGIDYVILFPGASAYLKRWHTDRFAAVARHILEHSSYRIVIAGSAKDKKYARSMMKLLPRAYAFRVFDLTGQTSIQGLAQLVNESRLLITNDSVPIHMAALYNKKAICVLMGENYGRFAPYPRALYRNGNFIFTPEVQLKVMQEDALFLDLNYNPDINTISAYTVIEEVDRVLEIKSERV
jgi:ADP-heptose:LPS heptosyltransferase